MKVILISILIFVLISLSIHGQTPDKKRYKASPVSSAPVINGILDDDVWQSGTWSDDFTQNEPYNGRKASQKTEFKILFNEDNLYVAIKAYDTNPDSIVNRLSRRDEVDGDLVGIIIDSFHDLRTGFLFGVSSAGVKFDQMFSNDGQNEDSSWDPNWWVSTSINSEGWIAEMKIPFSQVRFEKNSGDVWGMNIARILYRENETSFWQHIPIDAPGFIHLIGELSGLEKIKPKKIFDITPYSVAKVEAFKAEPENPFLKKGRLSKLNGGIDAKIGITNNMTMDLSINPDFGQVEADPSEVNLTAYETFFSEKRPFFIEGSNITSYSLGIGDGDVGNDNLFYSRRIGRRPHGDPSLEGRWNADIPTQSTILGAAKITGKTQDGLSIGFVNAITAEERAEIDTVGGTMYETVEPLTNYMVGRVQKDINNGNTLIGGIVTSTNRILDNNLSEQLHKSAYTGGIDFTQYLKDKSWSLNINSAMSLVEGSEKALEKTQTSSAHYFQRPDNDYTKLDTTRTNLAGSGGRMQIMKLNGHWNFMSATTWKTPGFETNDLGYLQSADQVLSVLWAGYTQFDPGWIYRSYNINSNIYSLWTFGGDNTGRGIAMNANMDFKNFWDVWIRGNIDGTSLSATTLRGGPMINLPGNANVIMGFSTDSRKKLVFSAHARVSQGFENSENTFHSEIEIDFKPTDYLVFSTNPDITKSFSELQYVTSVTVDDKEEYIFASINRKTIKASLRISLNLSPKLTLQYWGQPFIATGEYFDHKLIVDPRAEQYRNRFLTYYQDQISLDGDIYNIDENVDGTTDYSFDKEDFSVQEYLSNMVLRWEYNPGSSIYLVWNQTRSISNDTGYLNLGNDLDNLFDNDQNKPHNIFLIKFSYRFGLK
jgi:Domain of unknown function (DUF5916)/Carbohydrate family 9 binding domain-like